MGTILAILQMVGAIRSMFGSNGEMHTTNSPYVVPGKFDYSLPDVGVKRNQL